MSAYPLTLDDKTPRRFAVLLYRQWESIDVMGPLEALNTLSRNVVDGTDPQFSLDIITPNGKPASTAPRPGVDKNGKPLVPPKQGHLVNQQIIATHGYTFDPNNSTKDLLTDIPEADFLLIPGGLGPPPLDERPGVVEFIRQYYNKYLKGQNGKYLFTVCTGSGLAAEAGCLDGIYATTNKAAWGYITSMVHMDPLTKISKLWGPNTYWVLDARWVDQGAIWTTSGVSAGTDGFIAWMAKIYGQDVANAVTYGMEWNVMSDPRNDPFGLDLRRQGHADVPGNSGLAPYQG